VVWSVKSKLEMRYQQGSNKRTKLLRKVNLSYSLPQSLPNHSDYLRKLQHGIHSHNIEIAKVHTWGQLINIRRNRHINRKLKHLSRCQAWENTNWLRGKFLQWHWARIINPSRIGLSRTSMLELGTQPSVMDSIHCVCKIRIYHIAVATWLLVHSCVYLDHICSHITFRHVYW